MYIFFKLSTTDFCNNNSMSQTARFFREIYESLLRRNTTKCKKYIDYKSYLQKTKQRKSFHKLVTLFGQDFSRRLGVVEQLVDFVNILGRYRSTAIDFGQNIGRSKKLHDVSAQVVRVIITLTRIEYDVV